MKLAGFLLLSGWLVATAAVALLASQPLRAAFIAAGLLVALVGLVKAARYQYIRAGEWM
jgi:hypothetical protein